jgi:nascent polypeptide-associated complex subunit alpha
MMPGLNPKKMKQIMQQMGISQEELEAERVIIEKKDGRLIIDNPSVIKVIMAGQEQFQISGEIKEENTEEETEEEKMNSDIKTIVEQTGVSEDIAAIELERNNGDLAETIITLNKKK